MMPRVDFAAFGLALDVPARTISREGRSIKLTATQAMLLEWLSDEYTEPTLDYCCADLWETVDAEWVRGQWDRLATVMTRLGVAPLVGDADRIDLHHVDGEGCPVAMVRHVEPEISAPSNAAAEISGADDLAGRAVIAGVVADVHVDLLAARDADAERIAELEAERDRAWADLATAEAAVDTVREAADGLRADIQRQLDYTRAELADAKASLAAANDRNAELAARIEEALKARLKAEREASANGNVNAEPARETPVALSPRHVTIPVSEALYRWLEGTALHNRCSPEHVAARLLIAIRKATADDARRRAA
jgi:hypothetical protein